MELIVAPQNLTASWVNLGEPINMTEFSRLGLYINLDINDSLNARIRAMAKRGKNDLDLYNLPIRSVGSSDVKLEDEYFEFNEDVDLKMVLAVLTEGIVPFVQIQIQTGTAGVTPGRILSAGVEYSNY